MLLADEGLRLGDDLAHAGLDPAEVLVFETRVAGQLEVVVETIFDRRADRVAGAGPELEHGLGQYMGSRVAQDVTPLFGLTGDDAHHRSVVKSAR